MVASLLVASSAAIVFVLGALHLLYTFHGPNLRPRDPELESHMRATHMVITRETTVWHAWLGFNASHSAAAILFGLVYGFLALMHPELLFNSAFLGLLGAAFLLSFVILAKAYWFSVPFRCLVASSILYAAGFAAR